eukprot:5032559-Pyramimonas_sp.AAC.1
MSRGPRAPAPVPSSYSEANEDLKTVLEHLLTPVEEASLLLLAVLSTMLFRHSSTRATLAGSACRSQS